MSNELVLDPEKFISSKRASEITGYAQDYIGQLARGAHIEARRIGGLWHVSMESLLAYKSKAEDFKPKPPLNDQTFSDADAFVYLDGKEYISASRASKITGYNQDYVGQLARAGKIISRQVGNRWYVDKDALLAHKEEKDALLGAVQSEAVGIHNKIGIKSEFSSSHDRPLLMYTSDNNDLIPMATQRHEFSDMNDGFAQTTMIPIRVIEREYPVEAGRGAAHNDAPWDHQRVIFQAHGQTIHRAIFPVFALTVVVVLSFGFVSLKQNAVYTLGDGLQTGVSTPLASNPMSSVLIANASAGFDRAISFLERLLTTELVYRRTP